MAVVSVFRVEVGRVVFGGLDAGMMGYSGLVGIGPADWT